MKRSLLVVGGGGEIGAAVAEACARAGQRAVVADLDTAAAQRVAASLSGSMHFALLMDVTSESSVVSAFDAAEATCEGVAALAYCAGGTANTRDYQPALSDTPLSDWITTEALNARGAFLCLREFLRRRRRRPVPDAAAVLVSSIAGQVAGGPTGAAYGAAKAAMLALVRFAAHEAGPTGIRVNAVCPGAIDTKAFRATVSDERRTALVPAIPLRRIGNPEEVAKAVEFLLSPAANYITGATIDINGGRRMS